MSADWNAILLGNQPPATVWRDIFFALLDMAERSPSPVALHNETVTPDRLLSEAAWELWTSFPDCATRTSTALKEWCEGTGASGRAVLILDALSLRELPFLLRGSELHGLQPTKVMVTGSECPSTTDQFAHALGLPSRSALANDGKPGTLALFGGNCYTDVVSLPFEDCPPVPPTPNIVIWHSWLDDLIHLQQRNPDQIAANALTTLQSNGFWSFVDKLRQGRNLVITSDHGYGVSRRFSSEVEEPDAIEILRNTFGASRNKALTGPWQERFMPPIVMTRNGQCVVMGQRKWKVQGGFPPICHGGMTLLEVAVPWIELENT
jgi:hypothetical protein